MLKNRGLELTMGLLLLAGIFFLSRATAMVSQSGGSSSVLIMIDPGHGGADPGMIGVKDLQEKDVNLEISLRLRECLEDDGYQVVMTRETDQGLYDEGTANMKVQDLQRRCDMVAQYSPAVTVSIHQNSYSDEEVKGPQVFYYADSAEGEKLALAIQKQMNDQLGVERAREAKANTSYYLLKKSDGILNIVECGFLTNPDEAAKLVTEEYQLQIAKAISAGVSSYLKGAG